MKTVAILGTTFLLAIATHASAAKNEIEIAQAIAHANSAILISLEPGENGSWDSEGECAGHCYFGWPVLGQTDAEPIVGNSIRKELSAWVAAPEPDAVALCFNPRHGVRVQADGHTYDFLVCFECEQAQVFKDSNPDPIATLYYSGSQSDWDALLSAAKVPLAAPVESDGG
jgi:hypothetical protein